VIHEHHIRWAPGLAALLTLVVATGLAYGIGSGSAKTPGELVLDQQLAAQLHADAKIYLVTDPVEELTPEQLGISLTPTSPVVDTPSRTGKPVRVVPPRPYVRDFKAIAYREARRAGITHPQLFVRQIAAESGFQPCARSGAGALGIAQIMPSTAKSWHVDPFIPESALRVAARHMARYEHHYGSYALALAAYNAGPGAVSAAGNHVPAYPETRGYVARITNRRAPLAGLRQVYHLPAGMQPSFARRLQALRVDVRRHGGRLMVGEGWRSYDDQLRLWKGAKHRYGTAGARKWVAPPGCSNHNRGYAADLYGSLDLAHQLAPRHGLRFPMPHEPWHVESAHLPATWGGFR
jgi:hypothetical protein